MRRRAGLVLLSLATLGPPACIFSIDPLPAGDGTKPTGAIPSGFDGAGLDVNTSPVGLDGGPADARNDGMPTTEEAGADGSAVFNVLVNGGFEGPASGNAPCGAPWGMFEGKLTSDPTAHTGARACRVCSFSGTAGTSFTINYNSADAPYAVDAGTTLVAQAWARAVPGMSTSQNVSITFRLYDGATIVDRADCAARALGDVYAPVDCRFTTTKGGLLNVYLKSDAPAANECFLVDDFTVAVP